ncbi:universal stress protein [Microbulbifer aggregans]|uniref:universal stress protein n=1 Tax=Microbulbifer aggregans TaxID=1769779 RepID=UPI001CFD6D50|nr:universal stress protein [Microbulbifer aggregans]
MQKILVILDKPKHEQIALRRALELASKEPVQLHLVSFVYEPIQWLPFVQDPANDISARIRTERESWLETLKQETELPDGTTSEVVWHPDIPSWTHDFLEEHAFALVVKTAQKQFGKGGFGSIDWRLIESLPVPLWLAVNTHWIKRDRIVAALDPAVNNALHVELNQRVLKLAGTTAQALGADFEAVACMPVPDVVADLDTFREQTGALMNALDKVIADSGVDCKKTHFVTGKPAVEVNRVVDRNKARMIMVGRGIRKGARGFVLGNTAERILGRSNTDVLIVP